MTSAVSTPAKAVNPPEWSSPQSSPPPSSVTNRLLDLSSQSSPPGRTDGSPPTDAAPTTPSPPSLSSPSSPPSPKVPETPAGPDDAQPQTASPEHHQQGEANGSATSDQPAAQQPPVATRRSGRVRKRPADDSPADERRTPPKKASPSAAAVSKRVKREAARWQPASVLSNKRSPLVNFDLRALLCKPEAWTVLDKDEQAAMLALFPQMDAAMSPSTDTSTDADRPTIITALANDDNFRHDCARYRSDLEAGFFDNAWLADAFAAHAQRARGVFDAYVVEAFEANWGIPLPDAYRPASVRAGADKQEEETDKAKDDQHEDNGAGMAKTETKPDQETVAPPDEPATEADIQTTPEEPDTATADAAAKSAPPAPDDVTLPAKQSPTPRATVNKRAATKAVPAKTERPARRAPRSTPTTKLEKKAPGRVVKRKQASPVAEDKAAKDKAAAFDWEFHDDDGTEAPPADADADTGSDAGVDTDWKPVRKAARGAPAKRRASSTVAVRGRKKKTTPGPAEGDGDGDGDGDDGKDK